MTRNSWPVATIKQFIVFLGFTSKFCDFPEVLKSQITAFRHCYTLPTALAYSGNCGHQPPKPAPRSLTPTNENHNNSHNVYRLHSFSCQHA
jgi:hypothetical protein